MFRVLFKTGVAVGLVLVSLVGNLLLSSLETAESSFLWFLPAIVLSAWYGNFKTGLLSTGIACYCLIDPDFSIAPKLFQSGVSGGSTALTLLDLSQSFNLSLFLLEGGLLSALLGRVPFPRLQPAAQLGASPAAIADQVLQTVKTSNDGFYLLDRQYRCCYVNVQGAAYLQTAPTALLHQPLWHHLPELEAATQSAMQTAIEANRSIQFELCCHELWLEMQVHPTAQSIAVFARDITRRKQIESERDQLLRREQAIRSTAEQAEQRSAFLSEISKLLSGSLESGSNLVQAAQAIVPFLADGCLMFRLEAGRLHAIAIASADAQQQPQLERLAAHAQQRSPSLEAIALPQQMQLFDQALCETLFAATPEALAACETLAPQLGLLLPLVAHDRTLGLMLLVRDRSYTAAELALAEELARRTAIAIDNAQLYAQAQLLNRLKDEFLSTLSHELRTPLNVISGWTQLLQLRQHDEVTNQAIDIISRNARLQAQIIDELLDASWIITGRIQLQPQSIDLAGLIADVISSLTLAAAAKAIALNYHPDLTLGQLQLDPRYMRQIIWNLIGNAIKFTPNGGHIEVRLSRISDQTAPTPADNPLLPLHPSFPPAAAQLTVTDTGIGINPEFLPYVFDRFRQEDGSTTRSYGGLGLGLAIARHLVELHGGSIQAESPGVGQGATFTLKLPLVESGVR